MNDQEKFIRDELVFQLMRGNAHSPFEAIVEDFPIAHINDKFPNGVYTFWHLLEHIRRTQADILDFCINPNYKEIEWPNDYWPARDEKATKKDWDHTIEQFLEDRETFKKVTLDPKVDIYKKIAGGSGQTVFREVFVVADHNAYHLGEFSIMRQTLKTWGKNHE
ncbi:MAG TPA: DinB family protein [Patescibacteria group bacterium]|nr:DinB family protein [Patescibacteria group bacterium]